MRMSWLSRIGQETRVIWFLKYTTEPMMVDPFLETKAYTTEHCEYLLRFTEDLYAGKIEPLEKYMIWGMKPEEAAEEKVLLESRLKLSGMDTSIVAVANTHYGPTCLVVDYAENEQASSCVSQHAQRG